MTKNICRVTQRNGLTYVLKNNISLNVVHFVDALCPRLCWLFRCQYNISFERSKGCWHTPYSSDAPIKRNRVRGGGGANGVRLHTTS